jgi:1,4-alpha-glucan branching enzyme
MISQQSITPSTPMGANLAATGATFRAWAPRATSVHLVGEFNGVAQWQPVPENLMIKDAQGYWTGFVRGAKDGDPYKFYVVGVGNSGYKRDSYAREVSANPSFPHCNCILRDPQSSPA